MRPQTGKPGCGLAIIIGIIIVVLALLYLAVRVEFSTQ